MSKTFSTNDVASQGKGSALWVIIDEDVYDLTKFQDEHPGKFCRVGGGWDYKLTAFAIRWKEEYVFLLSTFGMRILTFCSPPTSRRKRRLETVLEVS